MYRILVSILHCPHPHSLRSLIISNSDETSSTRDCRAQHTADTSTYHGKLASALGDTERPLLTAGESGRERRSVVQRPFATFLLTFVSVMRSDEHSILSVDITERGIVSYTCQQLAHLDPRYLSVSSISSLLVRPEIVHSKRQHIDDTRAYAYSLTDGRTASIFLRALNLPIYLTYNHNRFRLSASRFNHHRSLQCRHPCSPTFSLQVQTTPLSCPRHPG